MAGCSASATNAENEAADPLAIFSRADLSFSERVRAAELSCRNDPKIVQCSTNLLDRADKYVAEELRNAVRDARKIDERGAADCDDSMRQSGRGCDGVGENALVGHLQASQHAWTEYRETQCDSESLRQRGGYGAHFLWNICASRIAATRGEEIVSMMKQYRQDYGLASESKQ
ncbi:lysozyme inhibitor LprI family protein [Sphingopyxis sp. PET50]|uniref:lysozyme inhibitor LprI family protein n=1 Tax=Sphingopyxis sp. PET50 TaxID=2976533 RepID=UPI00391CC7B4